MGLWRDEKPKRKMHVLTALSTVPPVRGGGVMFVCGEMRESCMQMEGRILYAEERRIPHHDD
jgi:hypothetical protein